MGAPNAGPVGSLIVGSITSNNYHENRQGRSKAVGRATTGQATATLDVRGLQLVDGDAFGALNLSGKL